MSSYDFIDPDKHPTILRNAAKCEECGTVVESREPDERVTCECGKVTVYGGLEVIGREVSGLGTRVTDLTEVEFGDG